MLSADFRNPKGLAASFQKDRDEDSLYVGAYVTLADLKPRNLRTVPGWTPPAYG
jgi:hypothetical protein